MPFYNVDRYLQQAIESVRQQTTSNWKLILLNDGSTDDSLSIAKQYESPSIQILSDGTHRGTIARWNELIRLTTTPYFAHIAPTDVMDRQRIEKQLEHLVKHPSIDVVGSTVKIINEQQEIVRNYGRTSIPIAVDDVLNKGCFILSTMMGRTKWFQTYGYRLGFHEAAEVELFCRTLLHSDFAVLDDALVYQRNAIKFDLETIRQRTKTIRLLIRRYASSPIVANRLIFKQTLKLSWAELYAKLQKQQPVRLSKQKRERRLHSSLGK